MKQKQTLGPLEKKIMEIVWQQDQISVRQVLKKISKTTPVAYTTVMTIMVRLVEKGFLTRRKLGKQYLYSHKYVRSTTLQHMISQTIHSFVKQFGDDAVIAFIEEVDKLKKK